MPQRWLIFQIIALALCVGCSESSSSPRCNSPDSTDPSCNSTGGTGGGGVGGTGGIGGEPIVPFCETGPLCAACPDSRDVCEPSVGCDNGFACIESGCATNEGELIHVCALEPASFCLNNSDCPEGRACTDLGEEGLRCVKSTPGCASHFDCIIGFSCEDGACVDRRVPCVLDADCPVSHVCETIQLSSFCQRVHHDCEGELDCGVLAPRCVDIDGDGRNECAGSPTPNEPSPPACVNLDCAGTASPVCELSQAGNTTVCGAYGLCLTDEDCVGGFNCVELWPDGRKECVPSGGDCAHITDCDLRQVCASPRTGGPPRCQAGVSP